LNVEEPPTVDRKDYIDTLDMAILKVANQGQPKRAVNKVRILGPQIF
jgi:hypothetical protein